MSQSTHGEMTQVSGMLACDRRSFLAVAAAAGCSLSWAGDNGIARRAAPVGISLESLRQSVDDAPGDLVARAVTRGWQLVEDETVLNRPRDWQLRLQHSLAKYSVRLSSIEAVVDWGRVTFASNSAAVRRGVLSRLGHAIRAARLLRCRHLVVVPGLRPVGAALQEINERVDSLMTLCRHQAAAAGMEIVVRRSPRRDDQVPLA